MCLCVLASLWPEQRPMFCLIPHLFVQWICLCLLFDFHIRFRIYIYFFCVVLFSNVFCPACPLFLHFVILKTPQNRFELNVRTPSAIICCSLFVCFANSPSEAQSVHFWQDRFLQSIRIYIDTQAYASLWYIYLYIYDGVRVLSDCQGFVFVSECVHDTDSLQIRATFHLCSLVAKVLLLTGPAL